jgi:thiamine biosynthesis lipoprotein
MPLDSLASVLSSSSFRAMGTSTVVAVEAARALPDALAAARDVVEAIDRTCSRFIAESELCRLNRSAGTGPVRVSPLLHDAIDAALDAAAKTGGMVDPTVGALIERLGYTVSFEDLCLDGPAIDLEVRATPGFGVVARAEGQVGLPEGVSLDLGAVGKAWAADRAATAAAGRVGAGVLVSCGGDVAVAGPAPAAGWRVRVSEGRGDPAWQDVLVSDGGLATSGRASRTWWRGGRLLHHILDPSTGLPAQTRWRTASVAAATCAEANAAATSCLILGDPAPDWLSEQRLPGRLVAEDGEVVVVGGWPEAA